eukprot:TRINITY_DN11668_c0_g1_i1.p3 TRINITY_DN11668_c0_g1~~TRINITY_DN11668_c0_g1_i1.p3  ORF type:complete len:108 (+),score=24.87 TRINITY_DN11668_c0_g1_i1:281-604(+)
MATSVSSAGELSRRVADALGRVEGAYSVLILSRESLVAVRDPRGFRPLVLGALPSGAPMLASESCALDLAGAYARARSRAGGDARPFRGGRGILLSLCARPPAGVRL